MVRRQLLLPGKVIFKHWLVLWRCLIATSARTPNNLTDVWREKNQQDATIRCSLLTSVSTCFGHHYAHLQVNKGPVTAFGVFWFCWMWLVAVVGRCLAGCEYYEGFCSVEQYSHPARHRPTTATNHIQQNQNNTPDTVTGPLFTWRWA
jgi:hypothetical protein